MTKSMKRIAFIVLFFSGGICGYFATPAVSDEAATQKAPAVNLLQESAELRIDEIAYGRWLPLRMQPTKSTATYQHSTYLSPSNAVTAKKVIAGLLDKKPMLLIRGPFGRLVIGKSDGLIHGMRPRVLGESFQGSYLREYAEGWDPKGDLKIVSRGKDSIVLDWKAADSSRRISVTRDGVIKTAWTNGPKDLAIFTGCHPYNYISADDKTAVRFSQLLQARRTLDGASNFAMFGYRDAALEIKAQGLKSKAEEIWLDSGEIGWEWILDHMQKNPKADKKKLYLPFGKWVRRNAALTYLAGGAIRKLQFNAVGSGYTLNYRVSLDGREVMGRIADAKFKRKPPTVRKPSGDVSVAAAKDSLRTTRMWPNDLHGWELRPLKLVQINPMPSFYALDISNTTNQERKFEFTLKKDGWIVSASIESDPETVQFAEYKDRVVPRYKQQSFWGKNASPEVIVPAKGSKRILLKIQPIEETLGEYTFTLKWSCDEQTGNVPLMLRVVPCCMVDPHGKGVKGLEDYRYFGNVAYGMQPTYFNWYYKGATRIQEDEFLDLQGQETFRKGYWICDHAWLRRYITMYTKGGGDKKQKEYFSIPPDEYVKQLRRDVVMRKVRFPYRYRVYLADEIFEILGGYKGHYYMPLPDVVRWTRNLIMDCPNPCWYSFMQPAIDAQFQNKLPNDIAELFYYCGRDEMFQKYVQKLVKPRLELVEQWKKDPACIRRAGTKDINPMFSFWIAGELHVIDYPTMRRQHWYTRNNGIDIIMFYVFRSSDMFYANRIGLNSLLSAGQRQVMMTDRSLAWHDLREDMEWISLVRLLKEKANSQTRQKVSALEKQAYEASQNNNFDLARDALARAVRLMAPQHADLVGPHLYTPVRSTPLEDLFKRDSKLSTKPKRKTVVANKLTGGHRPAPALDATLDNSYLEQGVKLDNFMLLNTYKKPQEQTNVHLAWDEKNLYVLFICNESKMDKLVAKGNLARDGEVYDTDCVELFVDRSGNGKTYMQFIVGAGGSVYDSKDGSEAWNPQWGWKVAKREGAWTAELHIPMSVFGGPPKEGETWRINFSRERRAERELSIWSPQEGTFGDPNQFGQIKFAK